MSNTGNMKQLERLRVEEFEEVWKIMEESFPKEERRTKEMQKRLWEQEKRYRVWGVKEGKQLMGFLAAWRFEGFVFLEHFAVNQGARNGGIGAAMLKQLKEQVESRIVLEVELPLEMLAKRRIAFYERNGFVYNDYPYIQPAMNKDTKPIPLRIMATGGRLLEGEFEEIRDCLYQYVYHQK